MSLKNLPKEMVFPQSTFLDFPMYCLVFMNHAFSCNFIIIMIMLGSIVIALIKSFSLQELV